MSSFEEIINYTRDTIVKTVWYCEESRELMVEEQDGECNTFYDVLPEVAKRFQWSESSEGGLADFFLDKIKDVYNSLPS